MATIYLKRKIERFYSNEDDTVFAVFEDREGYIHFYHVEPFAEFGERQTMLSQQFYKEYSGLNE